MAGRLCHEDGECSSRSRVSCEGRGKQKKDRFILSVIRLVPVKRAKLFKKVYENKPGTWLLNLAA